MGPLSGLPKLRQLVMAIGFAPTQETLRAASHTAALPPRYGSRKVWRPFPSVQTAMPAPVLLTRRRAASPPGPITVLSCT